MPRGLRACPVQNCLAKLSQGSDAKPPARCPLRVAGLPAEFRRHARCRASVPRGVKFTSLSRDVRMEVLTWTHLILVPRTFQCEARTHLDHRMRQRPPRRLAPPALSPPPTT